MDDLFAPGPRSSVPPPPKATPPTAAASSASAVSPGQQKILLEKIRHFQKTAASNRRCVACGEVGATYVCMTYGTFICTSCSGIHREFNHKVKGVSVTIWTPQEVDFILSRGNKKAKETYLNFSNGPNGVAPSPKPGNIEANRAFIRAAFVDKRWMTAESSSSRHTKTDTSRSSVVFDNATDKHSGSRIKKVTNVNHSRRKQRRNRSRSSSQSGSSETSSPRSSSHSLSPPPIRYRQNRRKGENVKKHSVASVGYEEGEASRHDHRHIKRGSHSEASRVAPVAPTSGRALSVSSGRSSSSSSSEAPCRTRRHGETKHRHHHPRHSHHHHHQRYNKDSGDRQKYSSDLLGNQPIEDSQNSNVLTMNFDPFSSSTPSRFGGAPPTSMFANQSACHQLPSSTTASWPTDVLGAAPWTMPTTQPPCGRPQFSDLNNILSLNTATQPSQQQITSNQQPTLPMHGTNDSQMHPQHAALLQRHSGDPFACIDGTRLVSAESPSMAPYTSNPAAQRAASQSSLLSEMQDNKSYSSRPTTATNATDLYSSFAAPSLINETTAQRRQSNSLFNVPTLTTPSYPSAQFGLPNAALPSFSTSAAMTVAAAAAPNAPSSFVSSSVFSPTLLPPPLQFSSSSFDFQFHSAPTHAGSASTASSPLASIFMDPPAAHSTTASATAVLRNALPLSPSTSATTTRQHISSSGGGVNNSSVLTNNNEGPSSSTGISMNLSHMTESQKQQYLALREQQHFLAMQMMSLEKAIMGGSGGGSDPASSVNGSSVEAKPKSGAFGDFTAF